MASDISKARDAPSESALRRRARPSEENLADGDELDEDEYDEGEPADAAAAESKSSESESAAATTGDDSATAADESASPFSRFQLGRDFLHKFGACFFSTIIHAALLLTMALWMAPEETKTVIKEIIANLVEERPEEELMKIELDEQIQAAQETAVAVVSSSPEVGVSSTTVGGGGAAGGVSAPQMDRGVIEQLADTGMSFDSPLTDAPPSRVLIGDIPDGALGSPRTVVDNYQEAMDQITQEILWMLSKSKVLVVWCFDESESMKDDQKEIRQRIDRVYTELGLTSKTSGDALTTGITSYGKDFRVHTKKPTSDLDEIRKAIDQVPIDPSGLEMMTQAVGKSILQHRDYARRTERQIALVLVTDESGDPKTNNEFLEQAIAEAKAAHCRVYILGREAVFGYPYAHIAWTHPQTGHTHWLPIDRGPETAFVEQLQTDGFHRRYDAHPSGFGPYEQSRLAQQSGGIFFMLPSLESNLVRGEKRRYELEAMRSYLPDMRARIEVVFDRDRSQLRMNLWKVIYDLNPYVPEISKIIEMRVHYSPSPDEFLKQAREDQRKAIIYLDYLAKAEQAVAKLRRAREQEVSPRWQANYDLLYAQLVAYQARIYEYGAYLEWFIHNPKKVPFTKPPNLTLVRWDIGTRKEILVPEKSQPYIDRATVMFQAVIKEHAGTPWAARAQAELARGFGVQLHEVYHGPYPVIPTEKLIPIPKL